jgi:hypothetical protein
LETATFGMKTRAARPIGTVGTDRPGLGRAAAAKQRRAIAKDLQFSLVDVRIFAAKFDLFAGRMKIRLARPQRCILSMFAKTYIRTRSTLSHPFSNVMEHARGWRQHVDASRLALRRGVRACGTNWWIDVHATKGYRDKNDPIAANTWLYLYD